MKHYLIGWTYWIDVCQSNGNLLASGGCDRTIKIFDKRKSMFVQTFDSIRTQGIFFNLFNKLLLFQLVGSINCVRWSPSGDMLASASAAPVLWDFKTGKLLYTGEIPKTRKFSLFDEFILFLFNQY